MKLAVIMTIFNRAKQTNQCLSSLEKAFHSFNEDITYFITNDGSTDETNEILSSFKSRGNKIYILEGNGHLFWNRGMHLAYGEALKKDFDCYLWVNNDVTFKKDFWFTIINDFEKAKVNNDIFVICGSMFSKDRNKISYGGTGNNGIIEPNGSLQECTLINGNCVLIPSKTAKLIGNLDYRYEHGLGDFDYSKQIQKAGGKNLICSDYVGYCEKNIINGTWRDTNLSISKRISLMKSKNGLPRKSYKLFLKKWNPNNWFLYYYKPYLDIITTHLGKKWSSNKSERCFISDDEN